MAVMAVLSPKNLKDYSIGISIDWQVCLVRLVCLQTDNCGGPAISLHSYHVSLVQWTTSLLPVMRDPGSIPKGVFM